MEEDLVPRAAAFAAELHSSDRRRGSDEPYFEGHLEPVARIVRRAGGDDVQVAAAYLHDTAEDHGGRAVLDQLEQRFGADVAAIVADLSDSLADTTGGEVKRPWHERKRAYVEALAAAPIRSLEVAAADKLHNASSILADHARIGDQVWSRFTVSDPAQQLWYHDAVARVVSGRLGAHPTAVALRQTVDALVAVTGVAPAS